jgi:hypothetical protein
MRTSNATPVQLIGDSPWQQLGDAIDGMLGDSSDNVAQVGLGVKTIQFCGLCRLPNYAERGRFRSG